MANKRKKKTGGKKSVPDKLPKDAPFEPQAEGPPMLFFAIPGDLAAWVANEIMDRKASPRECMEAASRMQQLRSLSVNDKPAKKEK